eukprot:TRINITY_DN50758_c0_g1_i1.p1 TRINITY_DN50758_c0_g1~~TRINITY_DN50758_c0_g1_i1.p1  ORF type:complete len:239 (+),score=58.31 TRINITY_DN50758_c0_g1_i1:97-813(+)
MCIRDSSEATLPEPVSEARITVISVEEVAERLGLVLPGFFKSIGLPARVTVSAVEQELRDSRPHVLVVTLSDNTPRVDQVVAVLGDLALSLAPKVSRAMFALLLVTVDTGDPNAQLEMTKANLREVAEKVIARSPATQTAACTVQLGKQKEQLSAGAVGFVAKELEDLIRPLGVTRNMLPIPKLKSQLLENEVGKSGSVSTVGIGVMLVAPWGLYAALKWYIREERLAQRETLLRSMV